MEYPTETSLVGVSRNEATEIPTCGIFATSFIVRVCVSVNCHTDSVPDATHNRPFAVNLLEKIRLAAIIIVPRLITGA